MKDRKVRAVIMAGGVGNRLWPRSRLSTPKQFLALSDQNTLIQQTLQRLGRLGIDDAVIVCNEEHRFLVAEQVREVNRNDTILLEPFGRNTAPALALASLMFEKENPILITLAADHCIADDSKFRLAVDKAIELALKKNIVTFGVKPVRPHTGFGYIEVGDAMGGGYRVASFKEKPNADLALRYIETGKYYWNSGMFVFSARAYLNELKRYCPEIHEHCFCTIGSIRREGQFHFLDSEVFESCPSESIDYAVMEKTNNAALVPLDAGWDDIGSWASLLQVSDKDEKGNSISGDVICVDSSQSILMTDDRLLTVLGISNLAVVSTKDAVLVCNLEHSENLKDLTAVLEKQGRKELDWHREVRRPWGTYDSVLRGDRFQVKKISVNPGAKLSVQMHHHRAEHWIIVSGTAKVTLSGETFLLTENQSTYIPVGAVHSLENPGKVILELIEIQSGTYVEEDDIVRLEDRYGRM